MPQVLPERIAEVARACFALEARKTANLLARVYNAALHRQELEVSQFSTLCAIAMGRAESITDLARGLGVERSTLVRNLERLARDGLIVAETEGRRVRHALTARGQAVLTEALASWQQAQDRLSAALAALPAAGDPRAAMSRLRRAASTLDPSCAGG